MAVTPDKVDGQDKVRKVPTAGPKTLGGGTIVRPSSDHTYHVPLNHAAIVKYQVVDVDIVLEDKAGHRIILQGAAADAFADPSSHVAFADTDAPLGDLMVQVGEVRIDPNSLSAQSAPQQQSEASPQTHNQDADKVGDAPIRQTPVAQSTALLPSGGGQGADNYPFNPFISNIVFESPPAHTLPQTPAFQESNQVGAVLLAKTGTTVGAGILTGAYGATGADTNSSATAQMAPQVIANGVQNEVINANALAGQSFIKVLHLTYSGTGSVTSFTLSGLPKGVSIIGATPDGNGVYHLSAAQFPSPQGNNAFDLQLQYSLFDANAAQPDHQDFSVSLDLTVNGAQPAEYQRTLNFTISDALTAADLTNASNSGSKLVLPAQGISYQITAYGRDTVTGGRNNDTIYASGGGNRLDGAGGINTLDYSSTTNHETINATTGLASGGSGSDTFVNFQRFIGASAATLLVGTASTVYLASAISASHDTFESGGGGTTLGPETILGGATGTNTLSYIDATAAVNVNLATGMASGFGRQTISNIQYLVGSAFNDTLIGATATLSLAAGGANSNVTFDPGGGGSSTRLESITGSTYGVNTLTYLTSASGVNVNLSTGLATGDGVQALTNIEIVLGSTHADTLIGTTTTLALQGMGGNDFFDGGGGGTVAAPESIVGGTGDNTISFANAPGGVSVNLALGFAKGISGQPGYGYETLTSLQNIIGSSHSDSLVGAPTTHLISGGSGGGDTIDPGGGGTLLAPETIRGGAAGNNLLTYANATAAVNVNLSPGSGANGTATGYGVQTLEGIQRVVGSAYSDSLRGSTSTLELNGGSGGSDTFDGGGGGTKTAAETIQGNISGVNTLTFAQDSFGGVVANLQTHTVDANVYGYETVANIQILIGSALGNDNLTGAVTTLKLAAGSASASDTFDGGGGGTITTPETIMGGRLGSGNTLTFAADITTAINANLATGIVDAGGASGYGYEQVSSIQRLIGSAYGGDTLTGTAGVTYLAGQSTVRGDTFDGGGGGTGAAPEYIVGQSGVFNTLTFTQDTGVGAAGAITVDLRENAAGYGSVIGAYGYELIKNISEVIAPTFGDATLIGAVSGSVLIGGGGSDVFQTSGGASTLEGGTGFDTIIAQLGLNLIDVGLGSEIITGPSSTSLANSDTLSFANATSGVTLDLQVGRASGYGGAATLSGAFTAVIGSPFNDSLVGSVNTLALLAGSPTSSDTFDGGGGGTSLAPETIRGGARGTNTLSFARDSVASVNVNLQTGTVDGGGAAGYGYEVVSNIQRLIGSAYGGDTLIGAANTLLIDGRGALRADTFDGGGAGSAANPESILGAAGLKNTLEFLTDTAPGSLGGVYVNLGLGVAYGLTHGYANITNIYQVIGSSAGSDTLIGASTGSVLQAGNGDSSLKAGGGFSTLIAGLGRDTLDGTQGLNVLQVMGGDVSLIGATAASSSNGDTLSYAHATGAVRVNLTSGYATGYGSETLSGVFSGLIGSNQVGDTLVGSTSTQFISGGGGINGLIDPGGGGTAAAAETLIGGTGGGAILSFGQDTTTSIIANLSQTSVTTALGGVASGIVNGLGTVQGSTGYGYDQVSGFQVLIGSAAGGDTLIGGPGVSLVTAGQATVPSLGLTFSNAIPLAGSSFDGGGGGTAAAPEYLIGSAQRTNTLVFIADTAATSLTGALVDLSQDTGAAGYGKVTYGQVVEYVQNIHNVIGTATGADTLIADAYGDLIRAGGGVSTLVATLAGGVNTLIGGAGGGLIQATVGRNSIDGGLGAVSIVGGTAQDTLFFNDSLVSSSMTGGVTVDLSQGFATVVSNLGTNVETLKSSLAGEGAFAGLVGSQFNDTLIGSFATQLIKAGSSTSRDFIVAGGGGSSSAAETIIGAANGATTLSYATDTVGSISATLVAGTGFGTIAGTQGNYGYQLVANITELIGSAYGGDTLQGAANTLVLSAGGGANSRTATAADTFIGGGGGTITAPESIIGANGYANLVSFATDKLASVNINLATGIADARSATGGTGYGYEVLTNITEAVGSAVGGDLLVGSSATLLLQAGPNASNDTFIAGGGGSPGQAETIDGGKGDGNTLDYSSETLSAMTVDLRGEGGGTGFASSNGGQYGYQVVEGNIFRLIGSGAGNDSLIGGVNVTYMRAAAGGDTLDGGGGGYLQKPETLVGYSATPANASAYTTLSFNADTVASVKVDLAAGVVSSAGNGYGYEQVSNFQQVVGSAIGGDTLIGTTTTRQMIAGTGGNVSMIAGGGGTKEAPETLIGSSVGTNILDYGSSRFSINANLGPTGGTQYGTVLSQGYGYGVQSVAKFQEFFGSGVGGDVIIGAQGYILLQAGQTATTGDTFDGGGGGTSTQAESIIGNTTAINTLTFANDLGTGLSVSLNGGVLGLAQSAFIVDGGGSTGYGYVVASNIQSLVGSAHGGDLFSASGDLTGTLATLTGSAAGNDTLSLAADSSSSGVSIDLTTGTVLDLGSLVSISGLYDFVGTASGNDTFITGAAPPSSLNGGQYVLTLGAGEDSLTLGAATDVVISPAGGKAHISLTNGASWTPGQRDVLDLSSLTSGASALIGAGSETLFGGTAGKTFNATVTGGLLSKLVAPTLPGALNTLSFVGTAPETVVASLGGPVSMTVNGASYNFTATNFNGLIASSAGADTLIGGGSNDTLSAVGQANVSIIGGSAWNLVVGGSGNDTIDLASVVGTSAPIDIVQVGSGNETIGFSTIGSYFNSLSFVNDSTSSVLANLSTTVAGVGSTATITGYGVQKVTGTVTALIGSSFGGDTLIGSAQTASLVGSATGGADTFDPGSLTANVTISGASTVASSTLSFQNETLIGGQVNINLANQTAQMTQPGNVKGSVNFLGQNIHNVIGVGAGLSDTITADASSDLFVLGGGSNTIFANATFRGGSDTLSFALDTVTGTGVAVNLNKVQDLNIDAGAIVGFGNGTIAGYIEYLIGSWGADTLIAGPSTHYMFGGSGGGDVFDPQGFGSNYNPVSLVGGLGGNNTLNLTSDTVSGANVKLSSDMVTIAAGVTDPGAGKVTGYGVASLSNIQVVIGSTFGNDTLDGGGNGTVTVTLTGAANGTDILTFANDTVAGAAGGVIVDLKNGTVTGGYGKEVIANIHQVIGSSFGNDTLIGDGVADFFTLGGGADSVTAGTPTVAGAYTTILVGSGSAAIHATAGFDILSFASDLAGGITETVTGTGNGIVYNFADPGYGQGVTVTGGALYEIIGSATGGDYLIGSPGVKELTAPIGASNDTFDGGGGGTAANPEIIAGAATTGVQENTLTFQKDLVAGAAGGVNINLLTGAVTSTAYGYEQVSGIHTVIGSAAGNDTFIADNNSFSESITLLNGASANTQGGDSFTTGTGVDTIIGGINSDTINAQAATGGTITSAANHTGYDLITVGPAFYQSMSPAHVSIDPGGGVNTLVLNWQGTAGKATTFDFTSVSSTTTAASAIKDITYLDLSNNDPGGTTGVTYTLTPQQIINMANPSNHLLEVNLSNSDSLFLALTNTQSIQVAKGGVQNIYSSPVHNSSTLIASLVVI